MHSQLKNILTDVSTKKKIHRLKNEFFTVKNRVLIINNVMMLNKCL